MIAALALASCAPRTPWAHATEASGSDGRRISLDVTRDGFVPKHVVVETGETVTFVITRRIERTCVTRVVLSLDAERRLERDLPVDEPVEVTLHFDAPGELGMSCPMNMYGATIEVRGDAH